MSEDKEKKELEEKRKYARLNLKAEKLKEYAVSGLMTSEEYGQLSHGLYEQSIMKAPDEQTYNSLYLPALESKSGSIHEGYLKETSKNILIQSLGILDIKEALGYIGIKKELDGKYEGKSVGELDQKEAGAIISSYLQNMVEETITKKILPERAKARVGGLEKIFAKKEEEKK